MASVVLTDTDTKGKPVGFPFTVQESKKHMPEIYCGIDTAYVNTGLVVVSGKDIMLQHNIRKLIDYESKDPIYKKLYKQGSAIKEVLEPFRDKIDFLVMEGPAYHSKSTMYFNIGGIYGILYDWLLQNRIPFCVASPATVKKFIAGDGNADKDIVAAEVQKSYPDINMKDNNITDAAAMAMLAETCYISFHDVLQARTFLYPEIPSASPLRYEDFSASDRKTLCVELPEHQRKALLLKQGILWKHGEAGEYFYPSPLNINETKRRKGRKNAAKKENVRQRKSAKSD